MSWAVVATGAAAVVLAAVHVVARVPEAHRRRTQRSALSLASGVSVSFVFLHLLPEVAERSEDVSEEAGALLRYVTQEEFFLALVGLITFYGLERLARTTAPGHGEPQEPGRERAERRVATVTMAAFAAYFASVGALLWAEVEDGIGDLALFTLAVAVHFMVVDYGLRAHHRDIYIRTGRWLLSGAVLAGWALGFVPPVTEGMLGAMLAFLAGGVILVTLKEELPAEREGRWLPFAAGAGLYAVLLLAL